MHRYRKVILANFCEWFVLRGLCSNFATIRKTENKWRQLHCRCLRNSITSTRLRRDQADLALGGYNFIHQAFLESRLGMERFSQAATIS